MRRRFPGRGRLDGLRRPRLPEPESGRRSQADQQQGGQTRHVPSIGPRTHEACSTPVQVYVACMSAGASEIRTRLKALRDRFERLRGRL